MKVLRILFSGVLLLCAATAGAGPMDDPFGYFHVYSLGDIGSPSAKYHSDFQGVTGAAGSGYFNSFSLDGADPVTGLSLHTGGSATLSGAYYGGIEAGTDAHLGSLSIGGSVIAGADIDNFSGGSIGGDAIAAGSVLLDGTMTVHGSRQSGVPFHPTVDHAAVSASFRAKSLLVGSMAPTGSVTNQWGELRFNGTGGVNVVCVGAATLQSAWGFTITAPDDATVYVNVLDGSVSLDWTDWRYLGGIGPESVLLNMPNADTLMLTSANRVNILAPEADTIFPAGLVTGSLMVGDLQGGGQVNLGHFEGDGGPPIPEPPAAGLVLLGSAVLLRRRR